ncbi:O-acetyl-ADP-ribose deacetylase [Geminicoccus roseus]|uniref:O-acetyl-ADP-ribose deacetylase n=1 Tax=Geminicoccus roseus TaxID=404900 RepID=UPI000410E222|nr:O-acetyl-ADP-ribose deacetylase [Geminicoccus roseus]
MTLFQVLEADITTLEVDAVVNAANAQLAPGGGVCGAIHRAAGPELAAACAALGPCPAGGVRSTPGFRLPARFVLHAVGPVWQGGAEREDELLAACYRGAIELAEELGCRSIAFPAISTGIYGFPPERAAPIAVAAARTAAHAHPDMDRIVFACFGDASARLHRQALEVPY